MFVIGICELYFYTSGVGSAASGVGELESLEGNAIAQTVTGLVKSGAEAAQEVLEEEEEEEQ